MLKRVHIWLKYVNFNQSKAPTLSFLPINTPRYHKFTGSKML